MFQQDTGGAVLAFVTRVVTGTVLQNSCKFDPDLQEITRTMVPVKNPVIVFFPNGSTIVMPEKLAEQKGFFQMPTIINFEAVNDANSIAGRFKFSLNEQAKRDAWEQLEQSVISTCLAKGGYPLDQTVAQYSTKSIFFSNRKSEEDAVEIAVNEAV